MHPRPAPDYSACQTIPAFRVGWPQRTYRASWSQHLAHQNSWLSLCPRHFSLPNCPFRGRQRAMHWTRSARTTRHTWTHLPCADAVGSARHALHYYVCLSITSRSQPYHCGMPALWQLCSQLTCIAAVSPLEGHSVINVGQPLLLCDSGFHLVSRTKLRNFQL